MTLYTDISPYCCAVLASRVADGSLPAGDVVMADVRDLDAGLLRRYQHVHLFAGIGGMALGLAWAGWPVWLSVVTFGFPCQDISAAGKGEGLSGARSGLFYEGRRVVELLKPDRFIAENVGALESRGLDVVAASMESIGYDVEALRMGAWAVGAPHERERWWIVGFRRSNADTGCAGLRTERIGEAGAESDKSGAERDARRKRAGGESREDRGQTRERADTLQPAAVRQAHGEACTGRIDSTDTDGAGVLADAASGGREQRAGRIGNQGGEGGRGNDAESAVFGEVRSQGWQPPARGPWRRERDEWLYAGPPVLVYAGGAGREELDAAAEHAAGRPDPTIERGWTVPVLPGFVQHDWELPRLYQRGVGDAVHGVSGRLAGSLNRSGVMALGNAVVPQVVAAIAGGVIEAGGTNA